jgi:hypothetical protein
VLISIPSPATITNEPRFDGSAVSAIKRQVVPISEPTSERADVSAKLEVGRSEVSAATSFRVIRAVGITRAGADANGCRPRKLLVAAAATGFERRLTSRHAKRGRRSARPVASAPSGSRGSGCLLISIVGRLKSGLRGSNPCPRLGKPLYYHCTKPAVTCFAANSTDQDRISATTSSRLAAISSGVVASRFRRSSGSVFDGRTLKCQSGYSTEMPSSLYCRASA